MTDLVIDARVERLALRAYERGRARLGLARAAAVTPVTALAFLQCSTTTAVPVALAVAVLAALVGVFAWRGQDLGHGAKAGLVAGLGPFALPLLSKATGLFCSTVVCAVLPAVCAVGGLAAGIVLGICGGGPRHSSRRFWLSALAVTLCAGTVGCLGAGLMGLLAMALGLGVAVVPALLLRRAFSPS